jgi:MoaA/NifB/PqqE/SkfB family radical SAM enzyme
MEINVSKDTPLSEIKDDAFHREPIVNTVVKVINNLCTKGRKLF